MTQMQRSLLLLSRTSSPATRLNSLPMQCRAFETGSGFGLPCSSPFTGFGSCKQSSEVKLRKARVTSMMSLNLFKLPLVLNSNLRAASFDFVIPRSSMSISALENGCVGSFDCVGLATRYFSQVSTVEKGNKNVGGFTKYWKYGKPLAAQRRGVATVAASEDASASSLGEQISEDVKVDSAAPTPPVANNKQKSKVNGRKTKQSVRKKKNEQPSSTIASSEDDFKKSSKTKSRAKKSVDSKTRLSVIQMPDSVASTEQPNKKSIDSSGKEESIKAINKSGGEQKHQKMGNLKKSSERKTFKPLYPPDGKSVMVVESVTKSNVIKGYLGDMFEVLPSYGHIRDLAPRSGSVRPDDDFSMLWEVPSASWTHLKSIKVALSGATNLILASDPDREGEAIAWHIIEMLQQQDALHEGITVARVAFNEITEASVKSALQNPRDINADLVHAYLARRALDYLIGFNISPLLWRKLPGCQSAGRVQSAALSIICDREKEIEIFKPQEYWTIEAGLKVKEPGSLVKAQLTHFHSKKLSQFSISSETEAKNIEKKINSVSFLVLGSKSSKTRRNPPTPYITSTLQQDAANKLHFNATYAMKLAQKLYEGVQLSDGKAKGLLTYIRTDGLHISDEAINNIRSFIVERYGSDFVDSAARRYYKKAKNAQEAHEAIRPTDVQILPSMLSGVLDEDSLKLYSLIWARTVASQMEPAIIEQIQVELGNAGKSIVFKSGSSKVEFQGYQAVYEDAESIATRYKENEVDDRQEIFGTLKSLKTGDPVHLDVVTPTQHFTQPPPRYSEASLVKKLEELGIGRPSTYASTLKVLQDRNYVTVKSRVLHPEFRGRMVSAFLSHHFSEVTDYSFTADMETELDNVSAGLTEWKALLNSYWTRFSSYCQQAQSLHIRQVENMLEKTFEDYLFGSLPFDSRTCPSCGKGTMIFKISRFGAGYFIGCDQHPNCRYIAKTLYGDEDDEEDSPQMNTRIFEPKLLGVHPASNEKILLKDGPFGLYVQLGEDKKGYSPKRASIPSTMDADSITVEGALELLKYPIPLGKHPEDGEPVMLKLAKTGFSVKHRNKIAAVPKNIKPENITMEEALKWFASSHVRMLGRRKSKQKKELKAAKAA